MIVDIIKALFLAGIPVALFSYYLVKLTCGNTELEANNATELKKELKKIKAKGNTDDSLWVKFLRGKFLQFGGGFYGILTLMTYLHVEFNQFVGFFKTFTSVSDFFDSVGLSMLINFFIEAIMNLVTAFTWPIYWLNILPIDSVWLWFLVAFLSHWFATKYALSEEL